MFDQPFPSRMIEVLEYDPTPHLNSTNALTLHPLQEKLEGTGGGEYIRM